LCQRPFAGPFGTALIDSMQGLGGQQRFTFMRLFQVIGDIWHKQVVKSEIPELQLRLVEAICLCELHLPALMADIKMHQSLHIVFRQLRNFGE